MVLIVLFGFPFDQLLGYGRYLCGQLLAAQRRRHEDI
jgi:hypothetical protein